MIIRSVKVKNFKKHRELELNLDEKLNLIGGPNEAGKSTIAEAIHAGLFFKHSGNSLQLREFQSLHTQDGPSVELQFEAEGKIYTLRKSFLRGAGCTLSSPTMATLSGDKAEEMLGQLLSSQANESTHSQAKGEWAHLWVWQGSAGNNPTGAMAAQQGKMLQQLQEAGVMVALASEKDQKLAAEFSTKNLGIFVKGGKYKAGSNILMALEQVQKNENKLKEITELIAAREGDAQKYASDSSKLEQLKEDLKEIALERDQISEKLLRLNTLEGSLQKKQEDLIKITEQEELLHQKIKEIEDQTQMVADLEKKSNPLKLALDDEEILLENLKDQLAKEKERIKVQESEAQKARVAGEFVDLLLAVEQAAKDMESLHDRLLKIKGLEAEKSEFLQALGQFPQISRKELDQWTKLEGACATKKGILESIATEVEVLSGELQVSIDGEVLQGKRLLTDESVLDLGGKSLVKIMPGGGKGLQTATLEYRQAEQALEEFQRILGFQEKDKAEQVTMQRELLAIKIQTAEDKLSALEKYDEIESKWQQSKSFLTQLENRKNGMLQVDPNLGHLLGEDISTKARELKLLHGQQYNDLQQKRNDISSREELIDKKEQEKQAKFGKWSDLNSQTSQEKTKLKLLQEQSGNLEAGLKDIQDRKSDLLNNCNALQTEVEALEPASLKIKDERTQRALITKTEDNRSLELTLAGLKGQLNQNGDRDIYEQEQAEFAQLAIHKSRYEGLKKEAEAIKLLDELFKNEKDELTKNYAQPFAQKVRTYLSFVFGQDLEVNLTSNQNGDFTGMELSRGSLKDLGLLDFEKLSGGTREQVAAAVRLAMAEILAPAYGGKLPIVFDDAFAYSDAERLNSLQNMLYRASENGLQIILFSCNPRDYASLGAKEITLS
ncbi:AAA family ATPase [Aquiflexum sp. LQ15W]|uniref:AAA family ATPase n=1 Tax=Cognataquiflexum nitidum TaxID=2922272 RepID=UPI001F1343EE|nr:AAA family ATPase [Cognataquiflexum nitidum]MCH6198631.1 AAA family ATPase [Cognataquiflexum nitidum]